MTGGVGARLVSAIAAKDREALVAVLHPEVDFKGLTPGRIWEGTSPGEVVEAVLGHWFGESDAIEDVLVLEVGDTVVDTDRVGYRFAVRNPDGLHHVEQQAYYRVADGTVAHLRVVCSGYRRVTDPS